MTTTIFWTQPIQGSPTPGPWTCTSPWPVRNQAAQQEVSDGRASEASSVFTAAPHRSNYHLRSASCQHYGELYNYFIIYYNAITIEIKCTINVMHLSHPETIPLPPHPQSMEKLSSMKRVSGTTKVGGCCANTQFSSLLVYKCLRDFQAPKETGW